MQASSPNPLSTLRRTWNLATWQLMQARRADDVSLTADAIAEVRRAERMARFVYELRAASEGI